MKTHYQKLLIKALFILAFMHLNPYVFSNGFIYFQNAIELNIIANGSWTEIDVSQYVPENATGVVLQMLNSGENGSRFALRKKGSDFDMSNNSVISAGTYMYGFCGLNENQIFEYYIQNEGCKLYLSGYTDEAVHFFNTVNDISIDSTGKWTEIDVSKLDVPSDASGVIVQANGIGGPHACGIRAFGSTDERTEAGSMVYQYGNYTYLFCGINESGIFEGKIGSSNVKFNLIGYTKSPVSFLQNSINIQISANNEWTDIDLSNTIPPASNGVIVEINNTINSRRFLSARINGSTDTITKNNFVRNRGFIQGACGVDNRKFLEVYKNYSGINLTILGYSQIIDNTPPADIDEVRDGKTIDIDSSYSTIEIAANWNKSTDEESGIGRYVYAIGSAPNEDDILSWKDNGADTSVKVKGLNLTVGNKYFFSVKAVNSQGLQSNGVSSDGFTIIADPEKPNDVDEVNDGLSPGTDEETTYSLSELSANWNEVINSKSGILKYMYAIGTTRGGTELANWTDNGKANFVLANGLSLAPGSIYYFSVKAVNTQNIESEVITSNGIKIIGDNTAPSKISEVRDGFAEDADKAYLDNSLRANWPASTDNESGIKKYYYAIGTTSGGTEILDWQDNGIDTSFYHQELNLTRGTKYYVSIKAENESGLQSEITISDGTTVIVLKNNERVAKSGGSEDIQEAVDELVALGGGTVYIPDGDFQFTETIGMPGGICIIGMGSDKTILRSKQATIFDVNHLGEKGGHLRISGITFIGTNPDDPVNPVQLGITVHNIAPFRIDHCYFLNFKYVIGIGSHYNRPDLPQSYGVIDNCSFVRNAESLFSSMYGVTDTRVWQEDMKLGTHEATFVEDCFFTGCSHPTDAFGGGHYVLRYSELVDNASVGGHGPGFESSGRGTRCTEIYNNLIKKTDNVNFDYRWVGMNVRAGGGVVFNNIFEYCRYGMQFTLDSPGSFVDDDNDGIPDYPVLDQNREKWIWNNTLVNTPQLIMHYGEFSHLLILEDRDYFLRPPSIELDGFEYKPYTYPHPLRSDPLFGDAKTSIKSVEARICDNETFFAASANQNKSGIYLDTLTALNGVDSIVATNLTVYPTYNFTFKDTVCKGEKHQFNWVNSEKTGVNKISLKTAKGCDSIIQVNLLVNPVFQETITKTICTGESYFAEGKNQTTSNIYYDSFKSGCGCDSIIITNLIVKDCSNNNPNPQITSLNKKEKGLYIYPNPNNGILNLKYNNVNINSIRIYNQLGVQVYSTESLPYNQTYINLTEFKNGLYVIEAETDKAVIIKKIIKME